MSLTHAPAKISDALTADDYAIPPDATNFLPQSPYSSKPPSMTLPRNSGLSRDTMSNNSSPMHLPSSSVMRASLIPAHENLERSGYLTQMSENRLRSLKRRFVVLKNNRLDFYRTAKNQLRNEPPSMSIPLENIQSITRVTNKSGTNGLQITTAQDTLRYHAENDKATEDFFNTINHSLRQLTINEMAARARPSHKILSGWIIKVKHGHQKRFFASLIDQKLLFFKKEDDSVPNSQIFLQGARVCEKSRGSSDEYSGSSSDEATSNNGLAGNDTRSSANRSSSSSGLNPSNKQMDYSICIEVCL